MKKFLSLVLALVMTMSLVTVSAGAKDFTDNDRITYVEAVDVMSEIGVIDGYTTGDFKPTATLTRGAAAKIICNLILGPTTANALATTTAPYSDVAADSTFAGYIAYLAKEGIIGGYADGTFKPGNSLTGYAFLKMLLGALGYDGDIEGYTGANYSVSVAKQAIEAGLTKGLAKEFDGRPAVTREEACLYAFNTLKAIMVDYDNRIVIGEGSTAVAISGIRYDKDWDKGTKNDGNIEKDGFVQFAEQYFPHLSVETSNGMYGRPANTWKLKKVEIGTYTSIEPTIVYTENTKNKVVYSDLGKVVCDEYTWTAFVDGKEVAKNVAVPVKNNSTTYTYTAKGAVTEIYVDDDAETVTVVRINNYLGEVTKVKSDKNGEYITVTSLDSKATLNNKTFYVEGYEEDDYVVFTVDYDDDDKAYVIGEVFDPEVVTGTVSRVEKEKDDDTAYLRVDGDKISYSVWMVYDLDDTSKNEHPELEVEYNLYLDPNGYVLGYEEAEETVDHYLYVIDTDEEMGEWRAKIMLADGTKVTVDLDDEYEAFDGSDVKIDWVDKTKKTKSNVEGWIWKYSVSDKDVYSLKQAKTYKATADIKNGKSYMEVEDTDTDNVTEVIVDMQTTFVDVDGKTAYVGYKAVPDVDGAAICYVKNGTNVQNNSNGWYNDGKIVEVAFILDGEFFDSASTYFVIADKDEYESAKYDGDNYRVYTEAYINGEKVDGGLYVKYSNGKLAEGTVYKIVKTIEDGKYVTKVETIADPADFQVVNTVGDNAFWLTNSGTAKANKYDTNDETVYVTIEVDKDGDLTVSEGTITDLKADDAKAYVAKKSNDDNTANLVFVYIPYDGGKGTTSGGTVTPDMTVTVANGKVTVANDASDVTLDEITAAVVDALEVKGYSDVLVSVDAQKIEAVRATKNSVTTYFDYEGPFTSNT